ncbi:hypothetical protein FA10DRAFT_263113 [Acaromyces ingoldii]|uniref:Uncharacterized protein n=1 Tax=Acaromyces ingoldii TaxID=215250 RepID=A0A316YFJ7_9BASI|nr:hypothetical protein FA10DRAFT_263113 [Acaromyces ingoldii]PWN86863.1 hypothetical protein FA10DRAFT_263113 [Acaromyces ingoldii]
MAKEDHYKMQVSRLLTPAPSTNEDETLADAKKQTVRRQYSRGSAFYSTSASVSSSFVEGAGLKRVSHRRREAVTRQRNREQQRLRRLLKVQEETVHSRIERQERAFERLHERLHRQMEHQREEIRNIQAAAPFGSATDKYLFVRGDDMRQLPEKSVLDLKIR